jgi:hypothetical protein
MFVVAALAIAQPATSAPVAAKAQARAIVRIVSAARIRFGEPTQGDGPTPHETRVRDRGDALLPAKLVEFE